MSNLTRKVLQWAQAKHAAALLKQLDKVQQKALDKEDQARIFSEVAALAATEATDAYDFALQYENDTRAELSELGIYTQVPSTFELFFGTVVVEQPELNLEDDHELFS